jgi:hypothetical protein
MCLLVLDPSLYLDGVSSLDPSLYLDGVSSLDPSLYSDGVSSLDPSLYSDGVHFSDAGKRHLVRIIKFHLNPFIGLKPYNNYSPPANRKPAQFRNYKNDYSGQRNRQGDQRGKQYNRRNYVNNENEIKMMDHNKF